MARVNWGWASRNSASNAVKVSQLGRCDASPPPLSDRWFRNQAPRPGFTALNAARSSRPRGGLSQYTSQIPKCGTLLAPAGRTQFRSCYTSQAIDIDTTSPSELRPQSRGYRDR